VADDRTVEVHTIPYPKQLDDDDLAIVEVDGREIVLLKVDGVLRAIDRACPHEDGDLGEGLLFGKNIKCPVHGWIFELTTGRCLNQRGTVTTVYEVEIENDSISLYPKGENNG
jgi:nitrite reductase/ring-hydroxylating ferredoxin subunit